MTIGLIIGTTFGALVGLIHACAVFAKQLDRARDRRKTIPFSVYATATYFAIWTFALWVLFGSYVLYLWMIAVVIYAGHFMRRLFRSVKSD